MITPSYSATATERVLPRMALDFTTGVLDPRVSVVRALNTATRVNSSGLIEVVNANLPRFNHNPVTLAPRGLLIEELRTNLLLRSQLIGGTSWTSSGVTSTTNNATSPDGTLNATLVTENTATSTHGVYGTSFTVAAATTYSVSVYVKAGTRRYVSVRGEATASSTYPWCTLDTTTGAVISNAAVTSASATAAGNGWWRLAMTWLNGVPTAVGNIVFAGSDVSTAPATSSVLGASYLGNSSTFYLWGAQLEVGIIPTSYIPTVASQVTRNNDQVSMTGTNFSSWYNASEGTFLAVADASNANSANTTVYYASNVPATNIIYGVAGTIRSLRVLTAGSTVAELSAGAFVNGVPSTVVSAYKVNDYLCAKDGGTVQIDTVGAVPSGLTQLVFGSNSTFQTALYLNGHVAKFYYYPQRLTSAEVRAYSKFT